MKTIDQHTFDTAYRLHGLYLAGDPEGVRMDFSACDLTGVVFPDDALLNYVVLNGAELNDAELNRAELNNAELNGAKLNGAKLNGAELNRAKGLLKGSAWLLENFKKTENGIIVYKGFGNTTYEVPAYWCVEAGGYLEEVVNPERTTPCGCGVNFGTLEYIKSNYPKAIIWQCLIEWLDLAEVIVPFGTDGKARCSRLKLIAPLDGDHAENQ